MKDLVLSLIEEIGLILGRDVAADEKLLVEGGLDSFGIMQVVAFLESTLGLAVPDEYLSGDSFVDINTIASWASKL
ncbi:MAG: acyl carrier protein [Pseudomonadota bacterium]